MTREEKEEYLEIKEILMEFTDEDYHKEENKYLLKRYFELECKNMDSEDDIPEISYI